MGTPKSWSSAHLFTVGHSTRSIEELVAILQSFGISVLADIRTVPRSRHNPQYEQSALRSALRARGIGYAHISELGGLRKARKDSPNMAWRNASFRGYADYMLTDEFEAGLAKLRTLVGEGTVALMCAEAVPWRCHRSLVADALTARGAQVEHIAAVARASAHRLTPFAEVDGARVTYPNGATGNLITRGPFHLEATVRVLQRRPTNRVDVWDDGKYRRVLGVPDGHALVEVSNHGTIERPDLRYAVLAADPPEAKLAAVGPTLRTVLGLDVDPRPLERALGTDARFRVLAAALRGMRPPRFAALVDAFVNVVPFQKVSLDAGVAIVNALVERFGPVLEHGDRTYPALPSAEIVAQARVDGLQRCGMSRRKAETLREAARAIASGQLTEARLIAMSRDDAIRFLCDLAGIGPWSAAQVLLRGLGRLDVYPSSDAGAVRALRAELSFPPEASFDPVVERFGEHRGYLYFCSLGAALLRRDLIHPAPPRLRKTAAADR